jgi:uncharacterized membrane protein
VSIQTLAKGDGSRVVEPRRFVVRDPQSFAAVWAAHAGPAAAAPEVDFDTRMVAAVFAGQRPTSGFAVDIAATRREGDALVVVVNETQPDPSAANAQVIVSPYHVVSLPREDGEIRFNTADPPGQTTIIFKAPQRRAGHIPADPTPGPTVRLRPVTEAAASARPPEPSSTGLSPEMASTMAYLAGPFSGALILATERRNAEVRFHAWQAVLALGVLGAAAVLSLILAFAFLIVSPTLFWVMLWLSAATATAWVALWGVCLVGAFRGRAWKLPIAGGYAARLASVTSLRASEAP